MAVLTKQGEIQRTMGVLAFCKGKPFNINMTPEWARGWKEMAAKFRHKPNTLQCVVMATTTGRQCTRGARVGSLCTLHAMQMDRKKMNMIEKVAKSVAAFEACRGDDGVMCADECRCKKIARAAISVIREPTEEMKELMDDPLGIFWRSAIDSVLAR